jgi:membrane protein
LRAFWQRAYEENITGLAGMVAYNLMLAIFPFALLVLFVFGRLAHSPDIEHSILSDLQKLFPNVEQGTLQNAIERIRDSSTTIGVVAVLAGIWIGASFWGAMDTAFGHVYHTPRRSWVEQKRFSLVMLLVTAFLLGASVLIPTVEGAIVSTTSRLPFGLSHIGVLDKLLLIVAALGISFLIASVIYWVTPKGRMPWYSVWPGALLFTAVIGLANWLFPFYLGHVSNLSRFGGTVGFVLIALLWFYALSLTLLAGAVINAVRYEQRATGKLPVTGRAVTR